MENFSQKALQIKRAFEKCEIYLDGCNITQNAIVRDYLAFLAGGVGKKKSLLYASSCDNPVFTACTLVMGSFLSYIENDLTPAEVIAYLPEDKPVLYEDKNDKLYLCEICRDQEGNPIFDEFKAFGGAKRLRIKTNQDKGHVEKGNTTSFIQSEEFNRIIPYYGTAMKLGKLRNKKDAPEVHINSRNRISFFHTLFGTKERDVPAMFDTTSLIIATEDSIYNVIQRLKFHVADLKEISFSELFTVSVRNSKGYKSRRWGNVGDNIANLQICRTVSDARRCIDDSYSENNNRIAGIFALDPKIMQHGLIELEGILHESNALHQVYDFKFQLSTGRNLQNAKASEHCWILSKRYLEEKLTEEEFARMPKDFPLRKQIENIRLGQIEQKIFSIDFSQEDYNRLYAVLKQLSKTDVNRDVMIKAWGLLKALENAVVPIENDVILSYEIPLRSLEKSVSIWNFEENKERGLEICSLLRKLYNAVSEKNSKYGELKAYCRNYITKKILLVVPTEKQCRTVRQQFKDYACLSVITSKKINMQRLYDIIIVSGRVPLADTSLFLHVNAPSVCFFLYSFEQSWFEQSMQYNEWNISIFQQLAGLQETAENDLISDMDMEALSFKDEDEFISDAELETYLQRISESSQEMDDKVSATAEVEYVGRLDDGRIFLFSKKYSPYILADEDGLVKKISLDELEADITFIYARDMGNREDILEQIFEALGEHKTELQQNEKLVQEWKSALRRYIQDNQFNLHDVRNELRHFGYDAASEAAIRAWIDFNSGIWGPRKKEAFQAIAKIVHRETKWSEYERATRFMRDVHNRATKQITRLIPQIYAKKKVGKLNREKLNMLDQLIYDKLDDLAVPLTIDHISRRKLLSVPIGYVNRPLENEEMISDV